MALRYTHSIKLALIFAFCQSTLATPAAEITQGPLGYVSLWAAPAFSTLKPCVQGCLRYNGVYHCSLQGYYDLGKELQCGCSPQNYCFCDKKEASRATQYIQSCVATKCVVPGEVSAVLDQYNGYCATANTAVETSSSFSYTFTGSTAKATTSAESQTSVAQSPRSTSSGGNAEAASETNGSSSNNSNNSGSGSNRGGLGIGAIIGIAVGGVVLLAVILCASCCFLWRRHRNKKKAKQAAAASGFTVGNQEKPASPGITYVGAGSKPDVSPLSSPGQTPSPTYQEVHGNSAAYGVQNAGNQGLQVNQPTYGVQNTSHQELQGNAAPYGVSNANHQELHGNTATFGVQNGSHQELHGNTTNYGVGNVGHQELHGNTAASGGYNAGNQQVYEMYGNTVQAQPVRSPRP